MNEIELDRQRSKVRRLIKAAEPTDYQPGTVGKIATLQKRYSQGVFFDATCGGPTIFSPDDAKFDYAYRRREIMPEVKKVDTKQPKD